MITSLIVSSLLIFLTSFFGGVLPLALPSLSEARLKLFISLGAGLLLGMAFIHMIPESSEILGRSFGVWLLVGFGILLFLERFLMVHACEEHGCDYHTIGVAAFLGLTVHGIIEGVALGSSLFVTNLGPLVLVAVLSHTIPQGIALTSILKLAGKSKAAILRFLFGVSISGPVGALISYLFLKDGHLSSATGILLAISSGTFLYIGACDLLPELHRSDKDKGKRLVAFAMGILASVLSGLLMDPH